MADNDTASVAFSAATSIANRQRTEQQIKKMKDANAKYKDLLRLAKERIQSQEEELEKLKATLKETERQASCTNRDNQFEHPSPFYSYSYSVPEPNESSDSQETFSVVRVHQRIRADNDEFSKSRDDCNVLINGKEVEEPAKQVIWALIEYEYTLSDTVETSAANVPNKRFQRWRKFASENALVDHVRRNTGEPVHLPPYSLTPSQSQTIENEARQAVAHVTEEFRRFRVRAEVARKQADATVRALQSNNVQSAQRHIEGEDFASELEEAVLVKEQLNALKKDFAEQEAQWKEAYDSLLNENNALKSSGSEALLAAQWRHRYEKCMVEKEKVETALEVERQKSGRGSSDEKGLEIDGKYEKKYRDLKESFRLYRKKAKEIFDAQQKGGIAMLEAGDLHSEEDPRLSYLRNLMVNYLSSDPSVREHMEGAIGTVLKFSSEDCSRIAKQKSLYRESSTSWFG